MGGFLIVHSNTAEIVGVGPVLFERSKKAKRVIISVKPFAGVRVAVPYGLSFQKAEAFVYAKTDWIQKHLARMRRHEEKAETTTPTLDYINRAQAKRKLTRRLRYLARKHGLAYNRVFIRNQKTRWGSCSNKNNISLNIETVRLPQELMDYVILHELVHTRFKNHGNDFWAELNRLAGDGKSMASRLREYRIGLL